MKLSDLYEQNNINQYLEVLLVEWPHDGAMEAAVYHITDLPRDLQETLFVQLVVKSFPMVHVVHEEQYIDLGTTHGVSIRQLPISLWTKTLQKDGRTPIKSTWLQFVNDLTPKLDDDFGD